MRTSRFSEQPIALILKQADDGLSFAQFCRKAGISQQIYYLYGRLSRCKSIIGSVSAVGVGGRRRSPWRSVARGRV